MKPLKKVRDLNDMRVTRRTKLSTGHGDSHGWAVSYADLLMVLLSFFILYFNFSDETGSGSGKENALSSIKLALSRNAGPNSPGGIEEKEKKGEQFADLASVLKIDGMRVTEKEDHLLIDLESSSFKSGTWKLNKDLQRQVDALMDVLEPHKKSIRLTVIGHTDRRPLAGPKQWIQDNFDLSAARALTVLKYIHTKGIPENHASARAASFFDREARSVSFEIRLAHVAAKGGA